MRLLFITLFILPTLVKAQITTTNAAPFNDVEHLVEEILLGNGVTASNVTFNGNAAQIGFFNGVGTNIGLDSGIVMSSGNINDISAAANTGASSNFLGNGDPDLLAIAQINQPSISSSHDAAVLEFDFFVTGDTVEFQFVFASEEYPDQNGTEYINGIFNDAFGFFLSGPGITGPYSSPADFPDGAINVAVVPGTTTPISISTIYDFAGETPPQMNDEYYVNNVGGTDHVFNGFTTVMTAKYPVECGQEFHFKFIIGDCSDGTLDTGVFLGARSLGADGISVNGFANFAGNAGNVIGEDCGTVGFAFSTSNTAEADTLRFEIEGNAVMGEDFVTIPDSIILPAGVASDTIWLTTIADGILESLDTVRITLLGVEGCNDSEIYIQSIENMQGSLGLDSVNICPPETALLTTTIEGGWEPYHVSWNNGGGIGESVTVSPFETTFYNASITDVCGTNLTLESSEVQVQCPVEPANVFTPNGDGDNDVYKAINLDDYPNASIIVYNRYGKVVYKSDDYQNDWDGTHYQSGAKLRDGVYYVIITPDSPKYEYSDSDDVEIKRTLSSFVHIMR